MSEVISFRLNPCNPREAQALKILRTKQEEDFSSRQVLTDALISLVTDKDQINIEEFNTALEHFQGLIEKLSSNQDHNQPTHLQPQAAALKDKFLNSVRIAARSGLNLD